MSETIRYSDKELDEFRLLLEQKQEKTQRQIESLQEQITDITESADDDFGTDLMDDSSINDNLEMLTNMANRQRKYLHDIEKALVRIKNKVYGICEVTGELIDKRRLLAVPTTTKSVHAKNTMQQQTGKPLIEPERKKPKPKKKEKPKIITKVIRKSSTDKPKTAPVLDEDEFDLDETFDDLIGFDDDMDTGDDEFGDVDLDSGDDMDMEDDVDWDNVADSDTENI